jgi:GNAT superfamily N-acetyltransferase
MRFVDLEPGDPRLGDDVLPVLAQLRTELTRELLDAVYAEGHPQGLRFTAAYDDQGGCVAVAGWRLMATTVAVRKLYVDDLVTSAERRSEGIGAALLTELARRAREAGCRAIDLDSGVTRADAHRFYIRERMPITSFHFARELGS